MTRYAILSLVVLAVPGLILAGCTEPGKSGAKCESCVQIMDTGNGWCEGCNKGMVDGKPVTCEGCYKLKATGEGWCAGCNKGLVGGKPVACEGCFKAKTGGDACLACSKK